MTRISPISAPFSSSRQRYATQNRPANENKTSNLPVVIQSKPRSSFQQPAIYAQAAFTTQLVSGPARRGLKACKQEQRRYFNAYRQLEEKSTPGHLQWA